VHAGQVARSTRLEFLISLQTAKALGIDVPPTLLALADGVIEQLFAQRPVWVRGGGIGLAAERRVFT
jgi:hypothetical protein